MNPVIDYRHREMKHGSKGKHMSSTYTQIKLETMAEVLESMGFEYYGQAQGYEYVFQKYLDRGGKRYTLRMYTSVDKRTDTTRECGEDAIRLVVMCDGNHFGEGRVNRTTNWIQNMKKRIATWDTLFKVCPQCGNALKERKGKFGAFYGCVTFPKCGYTEKKV